MNHNYSFHNMKIFILTIFIFFLVTGTSIAENSATIDTTISVWSDTKYPLTAVEAFYVSLDNPRGQGGNIGGFPSYYLKPNEVRHIPPMQGAFVAIRSIVGLNTADNSHGGETHFTTCSNYMQIMSNQSWGANIMLKIHGPNYGDGSCDVY